MNYKMSFPKSSIKNLHPISSILPRRNSIKIVAKIGEMVEFAKNELEMS